MFGAKLFNSLESGSYISSSICLSICSSKQRLERTERGKLGSIDLLCLRGPAPRGALSWIPCASDLPGSDRLLAGDVKLLLRIAYKHDPPLSSSSTDQHSRNRQATAARARNQLQRISLLPSAEWLESPSLHAVVNDDRQDESKSFEMVVCAGMYASSSDTVCRAMPSRERLDEDER